jgi:hypothetical protein
MQPRPPAEARRDVGVEADFSFDSDEPNQQGAALLPRAFRARVLLVLWPAFMMAAVLDAVVFSVADPGALVAWSPMAVYTVGFLLFWVAIAVASAITLWLDQPGPWQAN